MPNVVDFFIREPGAADVPAYRRRVRQLACVYLALFVGSALGLALVLWRGRLLVTLAQRSNVETLTIAFFVLFFAYLLLLSLQGATGALRIAAHWLRARRADPVEIERRKHAALGEPVGDGPRIGLSHVVEREDRPGEAFELAVADDAGSLGPIRIDGAVVDHRHTRRDGSQDLLAFVIEQVNERLAARGVHEKVIVVEWRKLDDQATAAWVGLTTFARRLSQSLRAAPLWPTVTLTADDCAELERRLRAVCPAVRSEGFLPDWEYSAEHKLPVIPEPLGLVSLSRQEKRVDPVASMGCAVIVVFAAVALVAWLSWFPPWVPGK